jgi:hypothetical protein
MEPAIQASLPQASRALRAILTASDTKATALGPRPRRSSRERLVPNELVVMMRAPAAM